MQYRELGRTGLRVSEIGLGCEGFIERDEAFTRDMFTLALDAGVNCMDMYSPDPDLHRRVGSALRGRRESFVLQGHLCSVWRDGQYEATRKPAEVKRAFEAMLANLGSDYLDVGMIHYVDSEETWAEVCRGGVMDYAQEQKAQGRIRHIGMSSHNPVVALEAVKSGLIEVLMFSVNPCYDLQPGTDDVEKLWADESYSGPLLNMDPQREALYETCQRLGVGIGVMKAFGGGDLLDAELSPAGCALTVCQCIHYALTRPAVACVLCGAHSQEELRASLRYEEASGSERDYAAALASFPKISWKGHCMYCGHCAPCPKHIDVALLTKLLNLAKAQPKLPETVREHYAALRAKASDCIGCRACEKRCPFEVPVTQNLHDALAIFGS